MLKSPYTKVYAALLTIFVFHQSYASNTDIASFPLELINNSRIADDNNVYVMIKALNPSTGQDCFIHFDTHTGQGSCEDVTGSTEPSHYSYKLADFPQDNGKHKVYLPKVASGRIYFSLGYPMDMFVDSNSHKIIDPDGFKPRDSNYYTLYDKVEFSYTDAGTWINPTAVDFFSIPLSIEQAGSLPETKAGLSEKRTTIIDTIQNVFAANDKTQAKAWNSLFLNYSDDKKPSTLLRFMAPGKAMVKDVPGTQPFDPNYLANTQTYGFNYIDTLWDYYTRNSVVINCSEIRSFFPLDNYIFTGRVVGDQFVFTNQTGSYQETIDKPKESRVFFAGAGIPFNAPNNTPKAVIVRQLTSAFEVGLLPAKDSQLIDANYFKDTRGSFYQNNPLLPQTAQGPWYDLYSKALHSFGQEQPIYTFAYDDALGQDGTLHDPNGTNPSPAVITVGDMSGSTIPNPYQDDTVYTVTPIIGENTEVIYNGQKLVYGVPVTGVKIPFHVKMNGQDTYIYIKHPIVRPYVKDADGIVINHQAGSSNAEIIFPGKPKPGQ